MEAIAVAIFTHHVKYSPLRYAAHLLQELRSAFQAEAHAQESALDIFRNLYNK